LSLLQQLESLKQIGTDAFIKAVDTSQTQSQAAQSPARLSILQIRKGPHPPGTKDSIQTDVSKGGTALTPSKKKMGGGQQHHSHRQLLVKEEALSARGSATRSSMIKIASIVPGFSEDGNRDADAPNIIKEEEEEIEYLSDNNANEGDGVRSRFRSLSSELSIDSQTSKGATKKEKSSKNLMQADSENEKGGKEVSLRASRPASTAGPPKTPRPPPSRTPRSANTTSQQNKRPKVGFTLNASQDNTPMKPSLEKEKKGGENSTGKNQKTIKYSNQSLETENVVAGEMLTSTQQTIDVMKRGQKSFMRSMGFTLNLFKRANQKQEEMENEIQTKLHNISLHGNVILNQFEAFKKIGNDYDENIIQQSKEKELMKLSHLKAKLRFMGVDKDDHQRRGSRSVSPRAKSPPSNQADISPSSKSNMKPSTSPRATSPLTQCTFGEKDFVSDFIKLRKETKEFEEKQHLSFIFDIKWYLISVYRLREFIKRMNNTMVPYCLIKMLIIFRYLLILEFPITIPIFYQLMLDSKVFQKDEFRKNIVQEIILENIKTGLNISSEDFLRFLEENNFHIPSELLNDIRNNSNNTSNMNSVTTPLERRGTDVTPRQKGMEMASTNDLPPTEEEGTVFEESEIFVQLELPHQISLSVENTTISVKDGLLADDQNF
jgi:hypothetical protein